MYRNCYNLMVLKTVIMKITVVSHFGDKHLCPFKEIGNNIIRWACVFAVY